MISATKTKQGLRIQATLDPSVYETGVRRENHRRADEATEPSTAPSKSRMELFVTASRSVAKTFLMVNVIVRQALRLNSSTVTTSQANAGVFKDRSREWPGYSLSNADRWPVW
jgi:hypothetical protein